MRKPEGLAGKECLRADTQGSMQNKMKGRRTMGRTTEELGLRRARGGGCTLGGGGVLPQTTRVRVGHLLFRILLTVGTYRYKKSTNARARSVCDVRSWGRLW